MRVVKAAYVICIITRGGRNNKVSCLSEVFNLLYTNKAEVGWFKKTILEEYL